MAHTKTLEEKLFEEIKGRIKQTDMSVPYKRDDYYYFTRLRSRKGVSNLLRASGARSMLPREIMLDGNVLAQGHEFFSIGGLAVSRDKT